MIRLKRAYEPRSPSDGYRVLVDRLWPRGLRKEDAHFDTWLKDLAPSDALRKWFGHDPARFPELRRRYLEELSVEPARALVDSLVERAAHGTVTLLYAAHDEQHNNAVVLAEAIERRLARLRRSPQVSGRRGNLPAQPAAASGPGVAYGRSKPRPTMRSGRARTGKPARGPHHPIG